MGPTLPTITEEDLDALSAGMVNLERHIGTVRGVYGLPCVVAINRFDTDTSAELELLESRVNALGVDVRARLPLG